MSQKQKVLRHLNTGEHITPLEAIGLYGIYRLAARIEELRREGYHIVTTMRRDKLGRPYARYTLAPSADLIDEAKARRAAEEAGVVGVVVLRPVRRSLAA